MKPLKTPSYVKTSTRHAWHQVPGFGLCPVCGSFARVGKTATEGDVKTQYRYCDCGHSFKSIVRQGNGNAANGT